MNDVTKDLLKAMRIVAQMAEDLKKPCGTNPESPQAIRNSQYMNISYAARAAIARAEASLEPGRQTMAVWFGEMPESNGKMNWTTILYRRDGGLMDGVTIYRSEYKDRVRYEADRLRWLIGELEHRPNILAYDAELIVGAAPAEPQPDALRHTGHSVPAKFRRGDLVRKVGGAAWQGCVVGEYSTDLTAEGYAVESEVHRGSVQIYPAKALELLQPLPTPPES